MTSTDYVNIARSLLNKTDRQVKRSIAKYDLEDQAMILIELGFMQDNSPLAAKR